MSEANRYSQLSDIVGLCKRRGFVFQSSEIYGGLNSCWDYGPLGSQLKKNIKDLWWKEMTNRLDVVGIDASILMHPTVWKASGHIDEFTDPLVDCKKCKARFREDHAPVKEGVKHCPECDSTELTDIRNFNLMFKTNMGPVEGEGSTVFLRPETAQGIFVNFGNVQETTRKKLPFGIAQIGKSFRNEITPGNFTFRTREFEQMEMQYFVTPGEDEKWYDYWKRTRYSFYIDSLGLARENLQWEEHGPDALAHYAKAAVDVNYKFPFGWGELEGVHNRGNYDLSQHQEFSGKKLEYFDEVTKEKFIPFVIETAVGADRLALAVLCDGMVQETTVKENSDGSTKEDVRNVFKVNPKIAPFKVSILPLSKKEPLQELSHKIYNDLKDDLAVDYDVAGSIGKRYRRQDEIGTPFCITVDFDSLEDEKVTVRHRDYMTQQRVSIERLNEFIHEGLNAFDEFGG